MATWQVGDKGEWVNDEFERSILGYEPYKGESDQFLAEIQAGGSRNPYADWLEEKGFLLLAREQRREQLKPHWEAYWQAVSDGTDATAAVRELAKKLGVPTT